MKAEDYRHSGNEGNQASHQHQRLDIRPEAQKENHRAHGENHRENQKEGRTRLPGENLLQPRVDSVEIGEQKLARLRERKVSRDDMLVAPFHRKGKIRLFGRFRNSIFVMAVSWRLESKVNLVACLMKSPRSMSIGKNNNTFSKQS